MKGSMRQIYQFSLTSLSMRKYFKYKCTTFLILNNLPYKYESRSLTWLPCLLLFCFHIAVKNMDSLGWSSMYVVKQNYNLDRDLWSRIKMEGNKYCHLLHYVERGQIRRGSGAEKFGSQGLESPHISGRY